MKFTQAINPVTWINKAIDKRIENYGKGVGSEMKYNPLLVKMTPLHNDMQMTRRLLENSVWYSGIEQDIAYFYKKEAPSFQRHGEASESLNYFWADSDQDFRRIHTGFPQLISEKMVDLIIGNGYEIKVEQEEYQDDLDEMLDDNKFNMLLSKAIETESWSGGVPFKMSYKPQVSEYPIIEIWQPENYSNVVVCGRIVEDIFYIYYEKGSLKYRLSELYGVDKTKGAYIDYKLDKLIFTTQGQQSDKGKWIECPLSELEQTKGLKRIEFNGYFKRLSLYKPNKLPNSEFRYSILGESDYAGSYSAFDAIDEIVSTMIQEFRDSKLNRYFPEEYVSKNFKGSPQFKKFEKDHVIYADSASENVEKQKIVYDQGDIRIEKHIESYKMWVTQVLNNAGLSPLTIGVTGLEAIDSSAESQQEREKVSIRTRNKKIELWTEVLQDYLQTALEFRLMTKNMKETKSNQYTVRKLPEITVNVTFNDYILKSMKDRTSEVTEGFGVVWDTLTSVQYVHKDRTEQEQLAISARIKLANGEDTISQAELSALDAENILLNKVLIELGTTILEVNEEEEAPVIEENNNEPPNEEQE